MISDLNNVNLNEGENNCLQTIVDNIDAVIALCDTDKIVVMINRAGRRFIKKSGANIPEPL